MTPDEYGDIGPALRVLCVALLLVVLACGAIDWARARLGLTGTGSRCGGPEDCAPGWTCERGKCERPAAPRLACVVSPGGPL